MHRRWCGILKRLVQEETHAALDDHPLLLDVAAKKAAKERAAQDKAQLGERGSPCTTREAHLDRTWGDRAGPAPGLVQAAGCRLLAALEPAAHCLVSSLTRRVLWQKALVQGAEIAARRRSCWLRWAKR